MSLTPARRAALGDLAPVYDRLTRRRERLRRKAVRAAIAVEAVDSELEQLVEVADLTLGALDLEARAAVVITAADSYARHLEVALILSPPRWQP